MSEKVKKVARKKKFGKARQKKTDSKAIPKSPLKPEFIAKKVEEGESNLIANYCYHFGDPEAKPEPIEGEVCHHTCTETFNCTAWNDPATKARLEGFNEDGFAIVVLGCAMSPYLRFNQLIEAWARKGRKINPLKASKKGIKI
jgi:hypothetical protein